MTLPEGYIKAYRKETDRIYNGLLKRVRSDFLIKALKEHKSEFKHIISKTIAVTIEETEKRIIEGGGDLIPKGLSSISSKDMPPEFNEVVDKLIVDDLAEDNGLSEEETRKRVEHWFKEIDKLDLSEVGYREFIENHKDGPEINLVFDTGERIPLEVKKERKGQMSEKGQQIAVTSTLVTELKKIRETLEVIAKHLEPEDLIEVVDPELINPQDLINHKDTLGPHVGTEFVVSDAFGRDWKFTWISNHDLMVEGWQGWETYILGANSNEWITCRAVYLKEGNVVKFDFDNVYKIKEVIKEENKSDIQLRVTTDFHQGE